LRTSRPRARAARTIPRKNGRRSSRFEAEVDLACCRASRFCRASRTDYRCRLLPGWACPRRASRANPRSYQKRRERACRASRSPLPIWRLGWSGREAFLSHLVRYHWSAGWPCSTEDHCHHFVCGVRRGQLAVSQRPDDQRCAKTANQRPADDPPTIRAKIDVHHAQ
jgi:hypothetical protein